MKLLLNKIQTVSKFKLQQSLRMDLVKTNVLIGELLKQDIQFKCTHD